jgi:hypothetical protein
LSPFPQSRQQRLFVWEKAGLLLGINQFPVHSDLENPAARLVQGDCRRQFLFEFGRQTGGPIAIASTIAEFDGNLHGKLLSRC